MRISDLSSDVCSSDLNLLVRALDQRQRTIVRVASEIVKQQEGFFLHGVAHMRPLTLRQVAEEIGMHESTVSRVTSNKYLSCARRSEEHTSELQSLMRISYAVFCLKKKNKNKHT